MRTKKTVLIILGLLLLAAVPLGIKYYRGHSGQDAAGQKDSYYCPMHPEFISDRKDDSCPICGMNLVKSEKAPVKKDTYYCPMHPTYISDKKTDSCPICGMNLVKSEEAPAKKTEGMKVVEGRAPVTLDSAKKQMIGVRTSRAAYRNLTRAVLSSGKVAFDPDLYQAIAEYREAIITRDKIQASARPEIRERADALVRASELRLRQMGLSDEQLKGIHDSGEDYASLLLPGDRAWLYSQIYEYEIGLIKPGQELEAVVAAYPGLVFRGVIKAVDSILSAETRTLRIRAEVENPDKMLKPDMYAEIKIKVALGSRLAVPPDAIINTGARSLVFVDIGEGNLEPREVRTGFKADGFTEIISGLRAGDLVVTSGNFLVDSESRMKAPAGN